MFPLHDENPIRHPAYATYTIIGINVLCWGLLQGLGSNPTLARSICEYGLIPGELLGNLHPGTQIPLGHNLNCVVDAKASWYTPLTSMFMHGGWLHIIINMWFLSIFGDNVEDSMGFGRFLIFYLLCGFGAVALQLVFNPDGTLPMIGASGAIGGVMGGYALLFPKAPVHMLVFLGFIFFRIVIPAYLMLGYWFFLQLISAVPTIGQAEGGVAFWAHVGGFLTGIILIRFFCSSSRLGECSMKKGIMKEFIKKVS